LILSILIKNYGFAGIRKTVLERKIIEVEVSIVTALFEVMNCSFIYFKIVTKKFRIRFSRAYLSLFLQTIVTDLRALLLVYKIAK
jgi:hypothetical protein